MISGSSVLDKIENESKISEFKTVYKRSISLISLSCAMASSIDEAKAGVGFC
jgi:hypothetical protein